jgi:hypothetical protein
MGRLYEGGATHEGRKIKNEKVVYLFDSRIMENQRYRGLHAKAGLPDSEKRICGSSAVISNLSIGRNGFFRMERDGRKGKRQMKLLVATKQAQGKRKNDFSFTEENEIVHFAFECDGEKVDGHCGCKRSMSGLMSNRATTTMTVNEVDISKVDLINLLVLHYRDNWKMNENEAIRISRKEAEELVKIGDIFPIGSVVEKRGRTLKIRI